MFGVGLRELEARRVTLEDIHLAKVRPCRGHLAAGEPVRVREPAADARGEEWHVGALPRPSRDPAARQHGVPELHDHFPQDAHDEDERVAWYAPTQRP